MLLQSGSSNGAGSLQKVTAMLHSLGDCLSCCSAHEPALLSSMHALTFDKAFSRMAPAHSMHG